ncbi:hypothetical protein AFL01nite_19140 [Aeromicrobium flavum]|uniref:Uncharacterized protein n=1 Tax=Aeromicrobium flavum TaxID=416568 RepID=A0A512HVW3_9ACTN|nr:hypothetical protein [Aeromicrobium flavum]GEO89587.1 hypothetical protein AFL01nite_19140 [Aeromicrobium flavum]
MRRDQALLLTRVVASVVAVGVLLYVPVLIEETDEFEGGLLFLTLLLTGFMAGFPVLVSAVVHGWAGRTDTWTPVVAMSSAAVAHVIYMMEGGRPGNLIPTALLLILIYAALMFVGVWLARRATGDDA